MDVEVMWKECYVELTLGVNWIDKKDIIIYNEQHTNKENKMENH